MAINPPTFVADYESSSGWDTSTTPQSVSVTTSAGDVLVTASIVEGSSGSINVPTGNSLTYTARGSVGSANYSRTDSYTAIDAAGGTGWTLQYTENAAVAGKWGFTALRFSGSDGIGAVPAGEAETNNSAPSLTFTTTGDNSAIVVFVGDFNAADGTSRTWRTVNGITPTAGNGLETTYFRNSANYTVYVGYYSDAGAAGSKTVGLSAPTTMKASIVAIEVLGTTAVSIPFSPQRATPLRDASRAYFLQDDRHDVVPTTALLENEILGGATTALRAYLPASHADRREYPQQRERESDPRLLLTAELENELLGGATTAMRNMPVTHVDRREVPQQPLRLRDQGSAASQTLDPPLLGAFSDAGSYWQLYNTSVNVHSRAYLEVGQRRRDAAPNELGQPQLENELLGGATTELRTYVPATHVDRREVPQQRLWLVDQSSAAAVATDLTQGGYGPEWRRWRRDPIPPQQRQLESVPGMLNTAELENELLGGATTWLRTYVPATHDRKQYLQQRPSTSMADDLETIGTGATLAWWGVDDSAHHFAQWLPGASDPSLLAPPGLAFDPILGAWLPRWLTYNEAATHVDRRVAPRQRINYATPDAVVDIGTGRLNAWWSDDPAVVFMAATMPRYLVPEEAAPGTPYDPTLAPPYRHLNDHVDRRLVPQQRVNFAVSDSVVDVGTGRLNAWWSDDSEPFYIAATMPRYLVPEEAAPGTPYDPTLAPPYRHLNDHVDRRLVPQQQIHLVIPDAIVDVGTGRLNAWWSDDPTIAFMANRRASYMVPPDEVVGTGQLVAWWGVDDTVHHVGQQSLRLMDQSSQPVPPMPPELWASVPRRIAETWAVSRRLVPQQPEREWLPNTALLEDALLGGWDDILRHRTWYVDRREVPQQRIYPAALQPLADPTFVAGAEWRYKLIPATHKARWVLRQWWQQQMFQGSPVVLFEGTIVGGVLPGSSITGAGIVGGSLMGFSQDGHVTGEIR